MESSHALDLVSLERHNLLVSLAALGIFLLTVLAHRLIFVGWRPHTEFGLLIKDRCRLLSLPLLILLPWWWATVQIPQLFFISAEVFLTAGLCILILVMEPLRLRVARRFGWQGWLFPVSVYAVPVVAFLISVANISLFEGANGYAFGTVVVVFIFLHIVYFYLFRWGQFRHPLVSVLRARVGQWAYLGVLGGTLYFVAQRQHLSWAPSGWASIVAGLLVLLGVLILCEAAIASVFDYYFPVVRRTEIPTFFRDLVRGLLYIGLFLAFVAVVLKRDLNSLLVGSAVLTVSIGFALQETLGNFFAGLALRLSRPYALGDHVQVGQVSGRVDKIDWRQTSVLTFTGDHVNLPNSLVAKEGITNFSSPTILHARDLRVGLHFRHPPNHVMGVIRRVLAEIEAVRQDPAPEIHLLDFSDHQILYRIRLWIEDYQGRWNIETDVRVRLWYAFRREGLEMPYPTRTLVSSRSAHDYVYGKEIVRADVVPFLKSVDFLEALGPEVLETLAERARFQLYAAGETVFRQGDSGGSFYIIRDGTVRVEVRDTTGDVFLHNELSAGNYFGEMALLTGESRSATICALTDCELLRIDKEDLRDVITANREVEEIVSKVLARRQMRTAKAREQAEGAKVVRESSGEASGGSLEQLSEQLLRRIQAFFSY